MLTEPVLQHCMQCSWQCCLLSKPAILFTIQGMELMAQCAMQGFYTVYSIVFEKLAEEEQQAASAQSDQQDKDTASNLPAFGEHTFCTPTMLLVVRCLVKQRQKPSDEVNGKKRTHQNMRAFCTELLAGLPSVKADSVTTGWSTA